MGDIFIFSENKTNKRYKHTHFILQNTLIIALRACMATLAEMTPGKQCFWTQQTMLRDSKRSKGCNQ